MNDQFIPAGLESTDPQPVQPVQVQAQPSPPPVQPQSTTVPPRATPPSAPAKVPGLLSKLIPVVLAIGGILFGAGVYAVIQKYTTKVVPTPIPTPIVVTPTIEPTPQRYPTNISSSSGFLSLQDGIASFSSELQEFSKDDPALSPPNLVLPLGF